jgi:hypothetical protein
MNRLRIRADCPSRPGAPAGKPIGWRIFIGIALAASLNGAPLKANSAAQPKFSERQACQPASPCPHRAPSSRIAEASSQIVSPGLTRTAYQGKGPRVCGADRNSDLPPLSLICPDARLAAFPLGRQQSAGAGNPNPGQSGTEPKSAPKSKQAHGALEGSPRHIFFVVPAFHVSYLKTFKPLTPREKFQEWLSATYDPRGIALFAAEAATLQYSSTDGFCGYGKHWGGYGKCFASMQADSDISSFFGDFLFPVMLHQDTRYFRLGHGSFGARVWHAVSRVVVTHSDSGRMVFSSASLAGTALAGAVSNLYYPPQDQGLGPSLRRAGLDLGNTAAFNIAAEFWPDIKHELTRVF